MSKPRSTAYRIARGLGDAEAAARGPGAYARRRARRVVYRTVNRHVYRALRMVGLGR